MELLMQKKLSKIGKNIFPNNLRIYKKLNVGLIGTGRIAMEYKNVINSFNHKIIALVSEKQTSNKNLLSKFNATKIFNSFKEAINETKEVDCWIICTSWDRLSKNFKIAIKNNLKFLIEKPLIIEKKIYKNLLKNNKQKNFLIAYNRNYYDYTSKLLNILKKDGLDNIVINMPDPYKNIVKKYGKKINKYLVKFMTSHWIAFFYKIISILNYKIIKKEKTKNNESSNKTIVLTLKNKKNSKKIFATINLLPDNNSNLNVDIFSKRTHININPFELIKISKNIRKFRSKSNNIYKVKYDYLIVNDKYKPGYRYMYYDFIKSCVLNTEKSYLGTNALDLLEIYKICELLEN